MYIEKLGERDASKKTIYLDVDDVVMKTSEQLIQMIMNTYPEVGKISRGQVVQYNYRNFHPSIDVALMVETNEFLDKVEMNEDVIHVIEVLFSRFNWAFVTKGTERNIVYKYAIMSTNPFLLKHWDEFSFFGMDNSESKSQIDMSDGVLVDDVYENMVETNAQVKVLFRHPDTYGESDYNGCRVIDGSLDNLYVCETPDQIQQILEFVGEVGLTDEELFGYEG